MPTTCARSAQGSSAKDEASGGYDGGNTALGLAAANNLNPVEVSNNTALGNGTLYYDTGNDNTAGGALALLNDQS